MKNGGVMQAQLKNIYVDALCKWDIKHDVIREAPARLKLREKEINQLKAD